MPARPCGCGGKKNRDSSSNVAAQVKAQTRTNPARDAYQKTVAELRRRAEQEKAAAR
jgi:hypothetical protein